MSPVYHATTSPNGVRDWQCPFCAVPFDGGNNGENGGLTQRARWETGADGNRYVAQRILAHRACADANPGWRAPWESEAEVKP